MTCSIRIFEKLNFTPKLSVFCFSQGQTSKYDRLAQNLEVLELLNDERRRRQRTDEKEDAKTQNCSVCDIKLK